MIATVSLIAAAVALSLFLLSVVCLRRARLLTTDGLTDRAQEITPFALVLVGALVVNKGLQNASRTISWVLDLNITWKIYAMEGQFVVYLQSLVPEGLRLYFSVMYVVGYVVLLVFPLIAYCLIEEDRYAKEIILAYAVNYGFGILLYSMFIAYGPRNLLPDLVQQPLFHDTPEVMLLTSFVNSNTNVFPSLHTSLSVSAMVLAWRTRSVVPHWAAIATVITASVALSTMFLGIHWVTDVVAGVFLGSVATLLAVELVDRHGTAHLPTGRRARDRLVRTVRRHL